MQPLAMQDVSLLQMRVRPLQAVGYSQLTAKRHCPRLGGHEGVRSAFDHKAVQAFCQDLSAEALTLLVNVHREGQRLLRRKFVQIICGRKSGYPAAYDDEGSVLVHSCTISTTALTCLTGVCCRIPCPKLKIWPGRPPARFITSST